MTNLNLTCLFRSLRQVNASTNLDSLFPRHDLSASDAAHGYLFISIYLAIVRSVSQCRLSAGAQRTLPQAYIAAGGLFARDELAEVARRFNSMADHAAGLIRDIPDRRRPRRQRRHRDVGLASRPQGSETQSDAASSVAAAVEEMTRGVDGIVYHA